MINCGNCQKAELGFPFPALRPQPDFPFSERDQSEWVSAWHFKQFHKLIFEQMSLFGADLKLHQSVSDNGPQIF